MKNIKTQPQKLAERIKSFRTKRGLTQAQLANRMGKDKQFIQRLESGKHDPKFTTLQKVAEGLGIVVGNLTKVK